MPPANYSISNFSILIAEVRGYRTCMYLHGGGRNFRVSVTY